MPLPLTIRDLKSENFTVSNEIVSIVVEKLNLKNKQLEWTMEMNL